jgi:GxxExxY protein
MEEFKAVPERAEKAAAQVVDAALKVHTALGPGLLESVYEMCLAKELLKRGLKVEIQKSIPIHYEGEILSTGLRLDLLVDETLIVELKAVEEITPLFKAQMLTYLKLTGLRLGLIINFNVTRMKNGIQRIVL